MTISDVSDKILDENFGLDLMHSEEINSSPSEELCGADTNPLEVIEENDLSHWGIKGMKWGVRRTPEQLGHKTRKRRFRDRQYEDETPQQHAARLQRESNERVAKTQAKEHTASEKRRIKAEADKQKRQLKSLENQQKMQIKSQEKQRKEQQQAEKDRRNAELKRLKIEAKKKSEDRHIDPRTLSDRELNDAIQRLRNEQTYKQLSVENAAFPKKTASKALKIGGGILLAVGTTVIKKQLTDVANMKAEEYLKKRGIEPSKGKINKGINEDDVKRIIKEILENND